MSTLFRSLRSNASGSSAVEFAIIFPVFILTVLTMIGYGIYISASASVQQITADAARTAIAGLTQAERQTLAADFVTTAIRDRPFIDPEKVSTTIEESPDLVGSLSVQIDYDAANLPVWSLFAYALPETHIISRTSVVRVGGI